MTLPAPPGGRPEAEPLRARMEEALGGHADPRAHALVRAAEIVIEPDTSTWEGSAGRVQGHRVALGLGASDLGAVSAAPHLEDQLVRAAAAGIAALEPQGARWTLQKLQLFWLPSGRSPAAGYRDAPPTRMTLTEAIAAFLLARGDGDAAARAHDLTVSFGSPTAPVTVSGAPRELRAALQLCLHALLGGEGGHHVQIAWASDDTAGWRHRS